MGKVRIAIVGVGNCASSLVQGLEYYKDAADGARVPGLPLRCDELVQPSDFPLH